MVLTKYTAGKNIWGDKTLDAAKYLDDQPPHVHPVAADLDINTIIDGIQNPGTGHIHDAIFGKQLPATSIINTALVLTPSALQTIIPSLSTNPGVQISDASMTATNPVPLRIGSGNGVDFIPAGPAIIPYNTSTNLGFFQYLLELFQTDTNKAWNLFAMDQGNTAGRGVNAIFIGDDGTTLGSLANGGAAAETATGNVVFLAASGSTADMSIFKTVSAKVVGVVNLVNADETQSSATVPNVDTTVKTYTLAANTYAKVIVEAEGYVQESALTTNQNINIKVKLAGTQVGQTMLFNPQAVTVGAKTPFPIKASGVLTAGGAVTVSIGAAVADANTTVFLNSLRVYGVY